MYSIKTDSQLSGDFISFTKKMTICEGGCKSSSQHEADIMQLYYPLLFQREILYLGDVEITSERLLKCFDHNRL